ncbi:hypothetical protein MC7420_491 [Coleofasciculus chthonoplastes PCC 7420]|uniref:Uncharacterized protein n=1 Tax=Coleofasciculus chthonoplastes PCC 7420 TaxID=118168 RepID=B4VKU8_9CYAN|nr:hypothetical protein MC7420_491 [Coleofasciculus chthonoplastes PCC 7420]
MKWAEKFERQRFLGLIIAVDTSIRTFGTIVETRHGASLHK